MASVVGAAPRSRASLTAAALAALALLAAGCTAAPTSAGTSPTGVTAPSASASARPKAPPTPAAPTSTGDPVLACVSALPEAVRIGQTMLVTTTDVSRVRGWLEDGRIAGILVNGRLTAPTAAALRATTSGKANRYGALLAADEEGGGVQRYSGLIGSVPSPQRLAWSMSADQVEALWTRHARALAGWGVDLVLAPVVDVGHGPGIGSRSFSSDPDVVAEYGLAAAEGIAEAGLLPVLKHFPGHGRATGDSHDTAVAGPELDTLREVDLAPFEHVLAKGPDAGVLVGHTTVPGLTSDPSSQSPEVIDGLLREELDFDGLVLSDALGMAAAGQPTQGDALVGFLAAGGDLGIVGPYGSVEGRAAVADALADGRLTWDRVDQAAARVLAAKSLDPCALAADAGSATTADRDAKKDSRGAPEGTGERWPQPDPPVPNPSTVP